MSKILKVVITGGPCAGKTSALEKVKKYYENKNIKVFVINETATELINQGITPWNQDGSLKFQTTRLKLQLQKENESLRERCAFLESKANNLNEKVSVFEADQDKIEEGIVNVLKRLNTVEDAVKTSLELASSDTTTSEDSSDVFENPISQSGESSNLFESSTTEPTVNPIEENLFSEENLENQQEEILEETEINLPIEETINFPSEDDVFNFDEPATEEEDNKPFTNQFDIF